MSWNHTLESSDCLLTFSRFCELLIAFEFVKTADQIRICNS